MVLKYKSNSNDHQKDITGSHPCTPLLPATMQRNKLQNILSL
jgi:hypothetical protein